MFIIKTKQDRDNAIKAVQEIRQEPLMCVEIKPYKKKRSVAQNAGYWPMLKDLAERHDMGNTDEDYHDLFKKVFLSREPIVIDGMHVDKFYSTTDLTTKEFAEYVENIRMFAAFKYKVQLQPYEKYKNGVDIIKHQG